MASPYDQSFKVLADLDPEALLRWMGALGAEEPATILTLPRELHTPSRLPDLLYEVQSRGARRLVHIEVQTRYHSSLSKRVLEYAALSWLHYRRSVVSYVLLLTSNDCPAKLPRQGEVRAGGLRMRYQRIKLWEVPPASALASNRPSLLPFVALMQSEIPDLRLAANRLGQLTDDTTRQELAVRFVTLGGLRHDRNDLERLVEDYMITHEDMLESKPYRMIVEKGLKQGLEQGRELGREIGLAQGRAEAGRRLLGRLLEHRFGPLPSWAAERLNGASLDTLEAWALRAWDSPARLEDVLV